MKNLARRFIWWWLKMDIEIEECVKHWGFLTKLTSTSKGTPSSTGLPSTTLDEDSCWLCRAHSRKNVAGGGWCAFQVVGSETSVVCYIVSNYWGVWAIFATHGQPETLVTDNGSCFTSAESQEFTQRNGIRHIRTSPYHPSSNGLAERSVQTLKNNLRKCLAGEMNTQISRFLFHNHITPQSTIGGLPRHICWWEGLFALT